MWHQKKNCQTCISLIWHCPFFPHRSWTALFLWSWWARSTGKSTSPWSCTLPQRRSTNKSSDTWGSELTWDRLMVHPLFSLPVSFCLSLAVPPHLEYTSLWSPSSSITGCFDLFFLLSFCMGTRPGLLIGNGVGGPWKSNRCGFVFFPPLFSWHNHFIVTCWVRQEGSGVAFNKPNF